MARYSTCTSCGGKTDAYIATGNIKLGPCCIRPEKGAMFIAGIDSQEALESWYKKFRPEKQCPKIIEREQNEHL